MNNSKYSKLIKNKKNNKSKNKDYITAKQKEDKNIFRKQKKIFYLKKKKKKYLPHFQDMTFNISKKESSPISGSPILNNFSQSPQLNLKLSKNNSNEESFTNSNKSSKNNLIDMRYNSSKIKLPSISKEKLTPMSVGFKLKKGEKDDLDEPEELVLCELSGSDDESFTNKDSTKNLKAVEEESNFDSNEVYLYKLFEDNPGQKVLNKFYGVLSKKEILFFSSDLKNELCDLWYIYKSYITVGKELINKTNYYTINITFFNFKFKH